uniref:Secreted protein n=1 Tax=Brassica campestris TaxID=3711 RepID=A0A3P5YZC1_BRACM|nr:unnamed protein product [Brassica rapa]
MLVLGLNTLALPTSVAVCGCSSAQTGRLWVSVSTHKTYVAVRDVRGCPSAHIRRPWLYVCVRVCPSAHTGRRPWVSVSTHKTSVAVRVCPCVSISTHRTSMAYTQDVRGCPSAHT